LLNVKLTNACASRMWWGMEVWDENILLDDPETPETDQVLSVDIADDHAKLVMVGCDLENAHYALVSGRHKLLDSTFFLPGYEEITINEGDPDEFIAYVRAYQPIDPRYLAWNRGGQITLKTCTFTNNAVGVFIKGASHGFPIEMGIEDCEIADCTFITTATALIDPGYNYNGFVEYPNALNRYYQNSNGLGRGNVGILLQGVAKKTQSDDGLPIGELNMLQIRNCFFMNFEHGIKCINSYLNIKANSFNEVQYGIFMEGSLMHGPFITLAVPTKISGNNFYRVYDPNPEDIMDYANVPVVNWAGGPWSYNIDYIHTNTAAIRAEFIPNLEITNNDFGSAQVFDYSQHENGVYLNNCHNFAFSDENKVLQFQRGIIVNQSDLLLGGGGIIGKYDLNQEQNLFLNCKEVFVTGQSNRNLIIRCNEIVFTEMINGIEGVKMWQNAGILDHQGTEPSEENPLDNTTGAGNRFDIPGEYYSYTKTILSEQVVEGTLFEHTYEYLIDNYTTVDVLSESGYEEAISGFTYFHFGNSEETNIHKPLPFNVFSDVDIAALEIAFDVGNSCDSPYNISVGPGDVGLTGYNNLETLEEAIDFEKNKLSALQFALDNYQMETSSMLNAIYGGISNEAELCDYLKNNSPLSKGVLQAYMERHNVPEEYFAEVFELNSIIDAELRALLAAKLANMDVAIADYLRQISLINRDIETIHRINRRINGYQKLYDLTLDKMVLYKYSIGESAVSEQLLQDRGTVQDKLLLAQLKASNGEFSQASVILRSITLENTSFYNIQQLMLRYWTQTENVMPLTASNVIKFADPKIDFNTTAFIQSELASTGASSCMIIPQVNPQEERAVFESKNQNKNAITIYPNPTSDYFRVRGLPANQWVEFKLIDANGKVVMDQGFTTTTDDKLIELDHITPSNYTFAISSANILMATGKITVQ
jgi:hypothetical protein